MRSMVFTRKGENVMAKIPFADGVRSLSSDIEKIRLGVASYTDSIATLNNQGDALKSQAAECQEVINHVNFENRIQQIQNKINDLISDLQAAGVEI